VHLPRHLRRQCRSGNARLTSRCGAVSSEHLDPSLKATPRHDHRIEQGIPRRRGRFDRALVRRERRPGRTIGKVGNIRAAALLHFFLEEIAPSVYNQAVAAVQERLLPRVNELDIDCFEDEFGYWAKQRKR